MNSDSVTFADREEALALSKKLYPNESEFTLIEHGYDNLVVLVGRTYAIRFPRNTNAYLRSQYECQILRDLAAVRVVDVPHLVATHSVPAYSVVTFLPGRHVTPKVIASLDNALQVDFANKVAEFAYTMHQTFSVAEAWKIRERLKLDELEEEPWDTYFKHLLFERKLPNLVQDRIAKEYYAKWQAIKTTTVSVVVHDDLHTDNMLFDEHGRLTGILDFADTNIGTPEQELRQLYWISEHVLETGLTRYGELSGQKLDIEAAKLWCVMQELAAYTRHILDDDLQHPTFKRATENLTRWLPHGEWHKEVV